jgi:hypothetical protein
MDLRTPVKCYGSGVRSAVIAVVGWAGVVGCAGSTPAASAPPPAPPASRAADADRPLDEGECRSLGQRLADACQTRPNERSARVDGWCSDVLRGVGDGSWVRDCLKHVRYMDALCLQSASNVHVMMDCDKTIDRSE